MTRPSSVPSTDPWPALPFEAWQDTCETLHLWMQIVGKVRLALTPWVNHSWHATLYVTPRGLTTSPIPYQSRSFRIDFDFLDHELVIEASDGAAQRVKLAPRAVADFYDELFAALTALDISVRIHGSPNEVPDPIPFREDRRHAAYDPEYAERFWRVLLQVDRVFNAFRTSYVGKVSPVHLFWGSLDLAVTRFSGRTAPPHPGGIPHLPDEVTREAYSHEVSSAGFWPGAGLGYPAFYSYAYPTPEGFARASVRPDAAFYDATLGEFVLPYDTVRTGDDPDRTLLEFLRTSYEAAATTGGWDRALLECAPGVPGVPRRM